jgi:hypothetical protein
MEQTTMTSKGTVSREMVLVRAVVAVVLVVVGVALGTPFPAVIGAGIGLWLLGDLLPR